MSNHETIQSILEQMTLDEKIHLLNGGSSFSSYPIPRLSIPRIQFLDGGTGMNWEQLMGDWMDVDTGTVREILSHFNQPENLSEEHQRIRETFINLLASHGCSDDQPGCYPPGILLGSTWNPAVVYECGQALGQEALAYHVDILLGTPNVNLLRNPLNGRFFEGYSEDPCLIATLAPELVKGVQKHGVLANVKHFAANNLEAYRQGVDEHIPERVLQELYFPGFRACVERGNVKTLMTAYNKINGTACTENSWLLQELLRTEWGFDQHLIISDWGAVYNQPAAVMAGNDVDMPGPRDQSSMYTALEDGTLTEEALNQAVSHMLEAILDTPTGKLTMINNQRSLSNDNSEQDSIVNHSFPDDFCIQAAYHAITEGAILLKNSDNTLPVKPNGRIGFIGSNTAHFHDCGDGSARVYTNKTTSLVEEFQKDGRYHCQFMEAVTPGSLQGYDTAVLTIYVQGQEGRDRNSLEIPLEQQKLILDTVEEARNSHTRIVLLLNVCGPVDLRFCESDVDAIMCIFFPGMEGGHGVKDLLTGTCNPSGKLPLTFPNCLEDCPTYLNPPSPDWTINYGEGIYVGYRYYDKKKIEPLYPFGYGLSYTTFSLSEPNLACPVHLTMDSCIFLTCNITNTGSTAGKETVQLYIHDCVSTLDKPVRELKAFQKVLLQPGETRTLTFELPVSALASFDPAYRTWAVEPGEYLLYIGQSSRNLQKPVSVFIEGHSCYDFQASTPFIRILDHPTAYSILLDACKAYGISESDFQGFAVYTPYFSLERVLDSVLGWKQKGTELEAAKSDIYQRLYNL